MQMNYSEIIKNWNNPEWTKWEQVEYIGNHIPNSKLGLEGIDRAKLFTNNYLIEKAIVDHYDFLSFYGNDHETFHTGWGNGAPDFVDSNGTTYELKSRYYLDGVPAYTSTDWYNADVHLVYVKSEQALYVQEEDNYKFVAKIPTTSL